MDFKLGWIQIDLGSEILDNPCYIMKLISPSSTIRNRRLLLFSGVKALAIGMIALMTIQGVAYSGNHDSDEASEIERDRCTVMESPYMAEQLADKWFARGTSGYALELDRLYLEMRPGMSHQRANKWYARWLEPRSMAIALEFDRLYLNGSLSIANIVADEWFERGKLEAALEFDNLYVRRYPAAAAGVADKWVRRGNAEVALEFSRIYLDYCVSSCAENPYDSIAALETWIRRGEFGLAEEFANRVLEIWVSEEDEKVSKDILRKLRLAARINSEYYYEKLESKKGAIKDNYFKAFKSSPVRSEGEYLSITDYLGTKVYIDHASFNQNTHNEQKVNQDIEVSLSELFKQSDITSSILNGIALHAQEEPYFRINIFGSYYTNDNSVGMYITGLDRVQMKYSGIRRLFKGRLVHELCHQLMEIVFENHCKPYREGNEEAKRSYLRAIEGVKGAENGGQIVGIREFRDIFRHYEASEYEKECIVKLAEVIAKGDYEDSGVAEAFKPLYDYWMEYVAPEIEKYIEERRIKY